MSPAALRGLGLARPTPFIEKRILAMATASLRRPRLAFLLGPLAGLLIVWACSLEAPTSEAPEEASDIAGPTAIQDADPSTRDETYQASFVRTITIYAGSAAILTRPDTITQVSVGDPTIADMVIIPPNQVMINGLIVGSTDLIVRDGNGQQRSYRIDVVPLPASDITGPTSAQEADPSTLGERVQTRPERTITIRHGEQAVLTLPGNIQRVALVDPTIAVFSVTPPNKVLIDGLTVGSTSLVIWGRQVRSACTKSRWSPTRGELTATTGQVDEPGRRPWKTNRA
jgi:Flp pilus assembly secretin CpaC